MDSSGSGSGMTRKNSVSRKRNASSDFGSDDDGGSLATLPPSSRPPSSPQPSSPSPSSRPPSSPHPSSRPSSSPSPSSPQPSSRLSSSPSPSSPQPSSRLSSSPSPSSPQPSSRPPISQPPSSPPPSSSPLSSPPPSSPPPGSPPPSSPPPLASDEIIPLSMEGSSSHPDPVDVVASNLESGISDGVSDPLYDVPDISRGKEPALSAIIEEDESVMFYDGGDSDAGMTRMNIVSSKRNASSDSASDDDGGSMATQPSSSRPHLVLYELVPLSMESSSSHPDPADVVASNLELGFPDGISDPFYNVPLTFISREIEAGLSGIIEEDESVIFYDGGDIIEIDFVGDKEPLSSLAAQFDPRNTIFQEKIQLLKEKYEWIRRTKGDGNCFFRCFMFSYLEDILENQDLPEIDRVLARIEQSRATLELLGDPVFSFKKYFAIYINQLEGIRHGTLSEVELLKRSRCRYISDNLVFFHRIIASGEIRARAEFYEPFIAGLTGLSVEQFCKSSVVPMGEESEHVHITALSDALSVSIRVEYLDQSLSDSGAPKLNHHDFQPSRSTSTTNADLPPRITLLYRPGHYDILYPKLHQHANANASSLEV